MELSQMLRHLWRHRVWASLAVLVAVVAALASTYTISSSGLKARTTTSSFGAAQGQFTVDTNRPVLVSAQPQAESDLISRARIVASFISAPLLKTAIAHAVGLPTNALTVVGPTPDTAGQQSVQPVAQQRANQLITESSPFSIYVDTDVSSPTVTLFVQADTARNAVRLANAVPAALNRYLTAQYGQALQTERSQLQKTLYPGVSAEDHRATSYRRAQALASFSSGRTVVRPLGQSIGGEVSSQSGKAIALLVGVVVLLALWALIIVIAGVRSRRRSAS
jgi:hypothetical protein